MQDFCIENDTDLTEKLTMEAASSAKDAPNPTASTFTDSVDQSGCFSASTSTDSFKSCMSSLDNVNVEDSKWCIEVGDNEAVEVSKETETHELPHVSTMRVSKV